jgi:predicted glycoside hydrolase/deacetylase ChbG (UPF0249 family)
MRLLAHLDDVGSTAGSVVAWRALRDAGGVRSASVMVPCPWYPMARDDWRENPTQDMGVHITLTSEWSAYRWRPMLGARGGLADADGFMHHRPEQVVASADPIAVADEMLAQVERTLADGFRPTHLDAHMGTALLPEFVWSMMDAGSRYNIPVLACSDLGPLSDAVRMQGVDAGFLAEVAAEAKRRGWPVFDRFMIGFCPDDVPFEAHLDGLLRESGDGMVYYGMHADTAEGMDAFAPHHTKPRRKEYDFFSVPSSASFLEKRGVEVVTWSDARAQ